MSRQYSSNNPFKGRPNNRPVFGTLRYTWKVHLEKTQRLHSTKKSQFDDCYGPYDNSVSYVYEIEQVTVID